MDTSALSAERLASSCDSTVIICWVKVLTSTDMLRIPSPCSLTACFKSATSRISLSVSTFMLFVATAGMVFCISDTLIPAFSSATLNSICFKPKSFCVVANVSIVTPISSTRASAKRVLSSSSPMRLDSKKVKTLTTSKRRVKIPEEIITSRFEN